MLVSARKLSKYRLLVAVVSVLYIATVSLLYTRMLYLPRCTEFAHENGFEYQNLSFQLHMAAPYCECRGQEIIRVKAPVTLISASDFIWHTMRLPIALALPVIGLVVLLRMRRRRIDVGAYSERKNADNHEFALPDNILSRFSELTDEMSEASYQSAVLQTKEPMSSNIRLEQRGGLLVILVDGQEYARIDDIPDEPTRTQVRQLIRGFSL